MIDEYIAQYGRRLFGLCMTLCTNVFDAEDLYQETWLKVCSKISRYDPKRPFEAWLTGICVNTYRDQLRRKRRNPIFEGFTTTEEKEGIIGSVRTEEKTDFSEIHEAIKQLPSKLRITVILFYFYSMSEKEVAFSLQIPLGTVKSRLNKAKKLLKGGLANEANLQFPGIPATSSNGANVTKGVAAKTTS